MRVPLDPLIARKLQSFSRKRRRLVLLRAFASTAFVFLAGTIAAALVDWRIVLSDSLRWFLSTCVYVLTGGVAWRLGIKPLIRVPTARQLARYIEQAEPLLREQLTSAVELGLESPEAVYDSPVFRRLLQRSVASRMQGVPVEKLLPARVIRNWLIAAGAAACLFTGLFFIPDLRFAQLVTRALLPMSNLGRVSKTVLTILQPNPPDGIVPQGDTIQFLVELSGPPAREVILETVRKEKGRRFIRMEKAPGARRYKAELQADEQAFRYRIRANDAVTAYHTIETRLRPSAVSFNVTYLYPEYSKLKPQVLRDLRRGDLSALQGTKATLVVHADQPIARGAIEMEQRGEVSTLRLEKVTPKILRGSLILRDHGQYKVHLVAAETGFDNDPVSPRYEIEAVRDEVPVVKLLKPTGRVLLPPDAIVTLQGYASDDVGLHSIARLTRVNGGRWTEKILLAGDALSCKPGERVGVTDRLDLLDLSLKPGDSVSVKLKAVDLKGTAGETPPVRIIIAPYSFSPEKRRSLTALRKAVDQLEKYLKALEELKKNLSKPGPQKSNLLEAAVKEGESAAQALAESVSEVEPGSATEQLTLAGHAVDWSLSEGVFPLKRSFEELEERKVGADAASRLERSFRTVTQTHSALASLLQAQEAAVLAQDLKAINRQCSSFYRELLSERDKEAQFRMWRNRRNAALEALADLIRRMKEAGERYGGEVVNALKAALPRVKVAQGAFQADLSGSSATPGQIVSRAADYLHQAGRLWLPLVDRTLQRAAARLRGLLYIRDFLLRSLGDLARLRAASTTQGAHALETAWGGAIKFVEGWAQREAAKPDSDTAYVADLDLLRRALEGLKALDLPENRKETAARLRSAIHAMQILEAGHAINTIQAVLQLLERRESWRPKSFEASTTSCSDWDFAGTELGRLIKLARSLGFPKEAEKELRSLQGGSAWKAVEREYRYRRAKGAAGKTLAKELRLILDKVARVKAELADLLAEARRTLREFAPPLSERMRALAEKARKTQAQTREAAALAPEQRPEAVFQAFEQQSALSEELGSVLEALGAEEQRQDLLTEEGREAARDYKAAQALLSEPASRAQQAMQQAVTAESAERQAQSLEEAASAQGELARRLDQLAGHFEALAQGRDTKASRAALREAERALGLASLLDRFFEPFKRLSELAALSPQELLKALEQELSRNEPMQRELTAIARNAAEEARSLLQNAARREAEVQERILRAESGRARRERSLSEKLSKTAKAAEELASGPLEQIKKASPGIPAATEALKQAAFSLRRAGQAALEAPASSRELAQAAQKAEQALAEAGRAFEQLARTFEQAYRRAQQKGGKSLPVGSEGEEAARALSAAAKAALRAGSLRQQAARIAAGARGLSGAAKEYASVQNQVAAQLDQAAGMLERAGRHEARQGRKAGAEALGRVAEGVRQVASNEVPEAQRAQLQGSLAEAAGAVGRARQAIENQVESLNAILEGQSAAQSTSVAAAGQPAGGEQGRAGGNQGAQQGPGRGQAGAGGESAAARGGQQTQAGASSSPGSGTAGTGAPFAPEAGRLLAHALDQLDQALFGTPGGGSQSGGTGSAARSAASLLAQAARAQAQSLGRGRGSGPGAPSRAPGRTPGGVGFVGTSYGGAGARAPSTAAEAVPQLKRKAARSFAWGKLPPKIAKNLLESKRAKVPPEYRRMVQAYFRAVAEEARRQGK